MKTAAREIESCLGDIAATLALLPRHPTMEVVQALHNADSTLSTPAHNS